MLFLAYIVGLLVSYSLVGEVVYNIWLWKIIFMYNPKAILLILFGVIILFASTAYYFYAQLKENSITFIELKDISYIWTKHTKEETSKTQLQKETLTVRESTAISDSTISMLSRITYKDKKVQRIFLSLIVEKIRLFNDEELAIILKVFDVLDLYGKASSVSSKFSNDYEVKAIEDIDYFKEYKQGKTNYELLSQVTLIDHIDNVLKCMLLLNDNRKQQISNSLNEQIISYPSIVIAVLLHDIGKITDKNFLASINVTEDFITINKSLKGHKSVSVIYTKSIFGKFANTRDGKDIITAIEEHHNPIEPKEKLLSNLLFNADKDARKLDSKIIIDAIKEEVRKSNTNNLENPQSKPHSVTSVLAEITDNGNENKEQFNELIFALKNINNINAILSSKTNIVTPNDLFNDLKAIKSTTTLDGSVYYSFAGIKEIVEIDILNRKLSLDEFRNGKYIEDLVDKKIIVTQGQGVSTSKIAVEFDGTKKEIYLYKLSSKFLNIDVHMLNTKKDESIFNKLRIFSA